MATLRFDLSPGRCGIEKRNKESGRLAPKVRLVWLGLYGVVAAEGF